MGTSGRVLAWLIAVSCAPVGLSAAAAAVEQSAEVLGRYETLELTVTGYYTTFGDVPWDHWAFGEVAACTAAGLVAGFPDGTYRPTVVVSRDQMAVFIARGLAGGDAGVPEATGEPTFRDVSPDHWAFRYIEYAAAMDIVRGYDDATYRPTLAVDRGQMAVFVARAMARPTGEAGLADYEPTAITFADVTPTGSWSWCYKHVEYIAEAGVAGGYDDGRYHPERLCSRDQMAVFVTRALGLGWPYDNPFDPAQVDLVAEFRTPSGAVILVPGFYHTPYERSRGQWGEEVLTRAGPGLFRVRFSPNEDPGVYTYRVVTSDPRGTRELGSGSFTVTESPHPGFIRRSARAPRYFEFDSGAPYFPIGLNMCWPRAQGTYDYDVWMASLAEHGGNYIRLWLVNEWNPLGLENRAGAGPGNGLGRYSQEAAWRIDYLLDLAERLGIKVLMCIDSFNSLDAQGIYGNWHLSPYNAANGGPCQHPREFFTHEEAKRLFRQRLRYLVARWGHSPAVLAWEFWNEVDIVTAYDSAAVAAWHAEMARYLRELDPWDHLITTSFARTEGDPAVDGLPEMDFVQSHNYGSADVASTISRYSADKAAAYGKPHFFGEFGTDVFGEGNTSDPQGLHLHNGLWSAMLSGDAGTAMLWWWDSYVHPRNLYPRFAALAAFADGVDWPGEDHQPAHIGPLRFLPAQEPSSYPSLTIEPTCESWQDRAPCNQPHEYTVDNDGSVTNLELLSRVQHGLVNHPNKHNPATFQVTYPGDGTFEVIVHGVSGWGGAALRIYLNGSQALAAEFPDELPDDHETMHQYDGAYAIDVPAGAHTILVENTGTDWFLVSYRLTNYITVPNLRVLGLANETSALLWVQNRENTWWNLAHGVSPAPCGAAEIELRGITPGDYDIEQWDTRAGAVTDVVSSTSADGTLVITTPAGLTSDVAYKIRRRPAAP